MSQQYWGREQKGGRAENQVRDMVTGPSPKDDLEYAESARSHHGSRTKPVGDDHRVYKSSTRLKPAEPAVRPTLYV